MNKTTTPDIVLFALMLITLLTHADAWAIPHSVRVFDDQKQFLNVTKAANVPIPSAEKAFPGSTCGFPLTGRGAGVGISFDSNALTVIQVGTVSVNGLCIYDKGFSGDGSTIPSLMIANTILGDGVDNYLMTFAKPVDAVGLRLLTNFSAKEQVTLLDEMGHIISTENIDGLTEPNTRQFVGFQTKKTDIKSLLLETSAGQIQNEGIDALWVASDHAQYCSRADDARPLGHLDGGAGARGSLETAQAQLANPKGQPPDRGFSAGGPRRPMSAGRGLAWCRCPR